MSKDDQMLAVYRHDAHKMRGRTHGNGADTLGDISVNQDVPYGADRDAARLSRPAGKPEQTIGGHETHYRLSLITGDTRYNPDTFALRRYEDRMYDLLTISDAAAMHEAWLDSALAAGFAESVYYPATSLKYHTLLVGALVDCYRSDATFEDLSVVLDSPNRTEPFRTVYRDDTFALRITDTPGSRPAASLGSRPCRSWASVWQRLPTHPFNTVEDRYDMMLDANLRRIRAWSTALQYIEDYQQWRSS